jgi:hypothetical protein
VTDAAPWIRGADVMIGISGVPAYATVHHEQRTARQQVPGMGTDLVGADHVEHPPAVPVESGLARCAAGTASTAPATAHAGNRSQYAHVISGWWC